jgi:hypothetical protein
MINDDDEDDISTVGGVELHCAHSKMIINLIRFVSLCVFFLDFGLVVGEALIMINNGYKKNIHLASIRILKLPNIPLIL